MNGENTDGPISLRQISMVLMALFRTEVKTKSILIRFGKDISQQRVKNFKDTLNYVYEIRKIPSIIDMRYRDGVAINYGK